MKIFVAHSSSLDFTNELYKPLQESSLANKYDFNLPLLSGEYKTTLHDIKSSDIVIAEVSYASTGMGIELGWANLLDKKIIVFAKEGTIISRSLDKITKNKFFYTSSKDMIQKLSQRLEENNI